MISIKDDDIGYPKKSNTGTPWKDWLFDWIVGRYKKHNHPWKRSDQRVWHGSVYGLTSYFGAVFFFAFFGFLFYQTNKLYGFEKAILLAMMMVLFRINVLIRQMVALNKKW